MSIRAFMELFEETVTVPKRTSLELEAAKILALNEQQPVFFGDLEGSKAIGNLWGSRGRICQALEVDQMRLTENLAVAMERPSEPRRVDRAPFMENRAEEFDLRKLPIPRYFRADGGRYLTSGVVIGEFEGVRNISFHRMMLLDDRHMAIRLVPRHLFAMHRSASERGEELPIAIAIGLCPSILLPASMSVGYGTDELMIANTLRKLCLDQEVQVALAGNGVTVPAHAEFVLEGRITDKMADEGPFVDITGTVDEVRKQPVVEIDAVSHRDDPVMQLLLSSGPEHRLLMGMPREPVILSAVRRAVPRVSGVHLTPGSCGWLHGVVAIDPQSVGDAKNAGMAALGAHTSMKSVVVVDADIDAFDLQQVEWAIATRFQPHRDLTIIEGSRGSSLDPSAGETTSKMIVDATIKGPERARFARITP